MLPTDPNNQLPTDTSQQIADDGKLNTVPNDQSALNDSTQNDIINDVNTGNDAPAPNSSTIGDPIIQSSQPVRTDPFIPVPPVQNRTVPSAPVDESGGLAKEREILQRQEEKYIEEIGKELELEKEIKDAGVEVVGEKITLPEPLKKIGAENYPPDMATPSAPVTSLPLTKQQANKALHKRVTEAVVWLATWCLRQFKIQEKKD